MKPSPSAPKRTSARAGAADPPDGPTASPTGVGAALLYATVLTPLVVLPGVYFSYTVPRAVFFRVAVELATMILAFHLLTRRVAAFDRRDGVLWALLAFVAASAVAALAGVAPQRSLFGTLQRMWGVVAWVHVGLFYLALRATFDETAWDRFFRLTLAVGLLVAGYGVLSFHHPTVSIPVPGTRGGGGGRLMGTLGNPGYAGGYLLLTAGIAGWMWIAAGDRRRQWLYGGATAFTLYAIALTQTRSAILGLGTGGAVATLYLLLRGRTGRATRRLAGLGLGALLVVGALVVLAPDAPVVRDIPGLQRFESSPTQNLGARSLLWKAAIDAAADAPLLGVGPSNFNVAWAANFPPEWYIHATSVTIADRAHNVFLDVLATSGVAGLLAFTAVWAALTLALVRAGRAGKLSTGEVALFAGTGVAYLIYLSFWFEDHNAIPVFVALAAYVAHRAAGRPLIRFADDGPRRGTRPIVLTALVAITLSTIGYRHGVDVLRAARQVRLVDTASGAGSVEDRLDAFAAVADRGQPELAEALVPYTGYLRDFIPAMGEIRADPYRRGRLAEATGLALGWSERNVAMDPRNDLWWLQRSTLSEVAYALSGDGRYQRAAVDALHEAIARAPTRLRHYHHLAAAHLRADRPDSALAAVRRALVEFDGLGETHLYLAMVHHARGEHARAADAWIRSRVLGRSGNDDDLLQRLAAALDEDGLHGRAAFITADRLHGIYGGFLRGREPPGRPPLPMTDPHMTLGVRLPLYWLRAGETERALEAATRLTAVAPAAAPSAHEFIDDVRAGRVDGWLEREALSASRPGRPARPDG